MKKCFVRCAPFLLATINVLIGLHAEARSEYATKFAINRCTVCHLAPSGGGPRTLSGKYFGASPYKPSAFSKYDFIGIEAKGLYYYAEQPTSTRGGMGVMAVNISGNLEITPLSDETSETRLVVHHNLGGFTLGAGPRDLYLRWKNSEDIGTGWTPQYILMGRFIIPFGLLTDEHRVYTKIQTGSQWNSRAFDTGVLLSANPFDSLHYDLSIINGTENSGEAPDTGLATRWGGALNLRWMPLKAPLMIGASASQMKSMDKKNPTAGSLYSVISFHRWTGNRVPVSLLTEYAIADNWNASFASPPSAFVGDTNYASSILYTVSQGLYAQINWDFSNRLVLTYRYDELALDRDYPGDAYKRHGVGFKYTLGPNLWTLMRVEKASAGHPNERSSNKTGGLDAAYMVMSVGI